MKNNEKYKNVELSIEKFTKSSVTFRKNKPNSPIVQMNLTNLITMNYAIFTSLTEVKNKPNQTQFKANSNPIPERPKMNAKCAHTKDYEQFIPLAGQKNKPNSNPIKPKTGIISLIWASQFGIICNAKMKKFCGGVVLNPWLETAGVVLVALLGIFLGRVFSGLRKSYWLLGYFLPFSLVMIMVLTRYNNGLHFVRPFSWIVAGRIKFVILSFAVTMGLTVPLSRLPRKFEKILVCLLMIGVVIWYSVLPFLVPALIKDHLSNIQTRLSYNGICFQSTDYTCGPAAAVTALGKLGLSAEEGEIAVLSHTSPVAGTLPACLSAALQNRYGVAGLKCKYRHFDSIEQLRHAGLTLAMVRDSFLLDHCLAVLEVSDDTITVADPMAGMMSIPHEQFRKIWRFSGIVLERDRSESI